MKIRTRIWFEDDKGHSLIGAGGARLLSEIDSTGSLKEAAKRAKMSYRYAYKRVDLMNERLGKVVQMHHGGVDKGGAELTPLGKEVLAKYRSVAAAVERTIAEQRHSSS